MNGRRHQQKRGFKRVMVTLLTFVMLVSVCFPGMHVRAEDDVTIVTDAAAVEQDITKVEDTANASNVGGGEVTGDEEEGEGEEEPDLTSGQSLDNTANTSTNGDEEVNKDEPAITDADTTTTGNSESTTVETPVVETPAEETPAKSDAVLAVEALIADLPTVAEVDAMDDDGKGATYAKVGEAKTAYESLSDEDKTMVAQESADKLNSLIAYFSPSAVPTPATLPETMSSANLNNPSDTVTVVLGKTESVGERGSYDMSEYKVYDANGNAVSNGITVTSTKSNRRYNLSVSVPSNIPVGTYFVGVSNTNNQVSYYKVIVEEYDSSELIQSEVRDDTQPYWYANQGTDKITSVTLGGKVVAWGDANRGSAWTGSSTLSAYYGKSNISSGNPVYAPLTITPAEGYYVTNILVVCCQKGNYTVNGKNFGYNNPRNCGVNSRGNAFTMSFEVGTSGALTVSLPSYAFGHKGSGNGYTDRYMIFIDVAPVPTPLFVEYDYGEIKELIVNDAVFDDADGWVTASSNNDYGTGECGTPNVQFKYAYLTDPTGAGDWDHYANTVTDTAKNAAIAEGYYFTGWDATYYNQCDENYNFSDVYSDVPTHFNEGQEVRLITHVRLVAQWAPIKLNVTKVVSGLPVDAAAQNYDLDVYKDGQKLTTVSFTGAGTKTLFANATSPNVACVITPGTYTVVEQNYDNLTPVSYNNTMYYGAADLTIGEVTVAANGTIQELKVTNTYSTATPALKIVKEWEDASGNVVTDTSEFSPVNVVVTKNDNATETVSLNFADGWTAVLTDVNPADVESVVETPVPTGYAAAYSDGTTEFQEIDGTNYMLTVKKVTNTLTTTSITLDKVVTGNMGDWGKEFTFTITYGGTTVTETMTHSTEIQTITDVPIGSTVTITESGNDGYTVSATVDGQTATVTNNAITFTVGANGNAVVFTNEKEALIDTGIFTDTAPYIALLSIAAIGAFLMLSKRRYNGAY